MIELQRLKRLSLWKVSEVSHPGGIMFQTSSMSLLLLLFAGSISCVSMEFKPLRIDRYSQEKDVIVFRVQLSDPAKPQEYRQWSRDRIILEGLDSENPFFPGTLVYEVHVVFHDGRNRLATVRWMRSDPPTGVLEHRSTFVHSARGGFRR